MLERGLGVGLEYSIRRFSEQGDLRTAVLGVIRGEGKKMEPRLL